MRPALKKTLIALAIILPILAGAGLGLYYFQVVSPYELAKNELPQDTPRLHEDADGTLTFSWSAGTNADDYAVELLSGGQTVWSGVYTGTSCVLPEDAAGKTVRVTARKKYRTPRGEDYRLCEEPLEVRLPAGVPDLDTVVTTVDPDDDTLLISWQGTDGEAVSVYDENGVLMRTVRENFTLISFKEDVPMPRKDESSSFTLTAALEDIEVEFSTDKSATVTVRGEELRGTRLIMELDELGNNYYTLSWNETRGDVYELQELNGDGTWRTLGSFTDDVPLSFTVGPLKAYTDHTYRVFAAYRGGAEGSGYAAEPDQVSFTTGPTVIYATIWPLTDLDIYSDTSMKTKVGVASAANSYCVTAEEDGMFLIYFDGGRGYIDSTYCLINLPDYLGDICAYDIKNSYDAIYMVHDYGIPTVTGTVITGYEEVASGLVPGYAWKSEAREDPEGGEDAEEPAEGSGENKDVPKPALPGTPTVVDGRFVDVNGEPLSAPEEVRPPVTTADGEELTPGDIGLETVAEIYSEDSEYSLERVEVETPTEFLVPLLYPTAKKIAQSAQKAWELGYRLKIYDAFRPYNATRMLYDTAEALLETQIPPYVYDLMDGEMWSDWVDTLFPPETDGEEQGGTGADTDADAQTDEDTAEAPEDGADTQAETPAEPRASYYEIMTNGRYKLNAFLAKSGSTHNQGVAVDITLESLETGEELRMQTAMHDLSWNSVLSFNNDEAKLLAEIMTGSDLGTLVSEWWHFQDNELRSAVKLVYRAEGVTRAGWTADTTGWRYRLRSGEFLADGTYIVDGHTYTFDKEGYSDYTAWEIPEDVLD